MAVDTEKTLRNQVLYSIYVRNYSEAGTFAAVQADLDRIKALGTDIIWLLPIHPTGEKHRKGTLGSPYAIRDYRAVNPEFGTLDDFRHLVDAIHDRGMKCIIDVVYNHTSPDSWLAEHHPEWFFHKPDGSLGNRFGDWWDVADLDYSHKELWEYQIETLIAAKKSKENLAFVGDGINDAPVLSRADLGIAMGALGSDAAIEAADVVLMDDDPQKIAKAIKISRKCLRIVYENIYFALGIKAICLILGALGIANMWMAIFADVGVMVIAVLNAIRALFVKNL